MGCFRASILDFRAKLANRCKLFPIYTLFRASILDFRPSLENRCSAIAATVRNGSACSSRSGNEVRVRFYSSLPQRRIARLQHRCEAQAGTGCHEGGIILSKKPLEWHLSLPQQRYASDSNLCRDRGEWFRLQWSLLQGRFARLQQAGCRQVRQRRQRRVLMRPEAAFPYVFAAEGAQHPLIGRRAERYLATQ